MQVTFTQSEDDIIRYSLWQQWESPERRGRRLMIRYLPSAFFAAVILVMFPDPAEGLGFLPWWTLLFLVVAGALPIFILPYLVRALIEDKNKSFLEAEENKMLLAEQTISLRKEGVVLQTPSASGIIEWQKFSRVEDVKELLLLSLAESSAIIIPHRAFGSAQARLDFKREAESLLGQNKKA